ncbi:MAG: EAL domain-containing protein [Pirellulaceae bacterium]|nr:EAL domain-containing protein [Pirellulaceae bacterium]
MKRLFYITGASLPGAVASYILAFAIIAICLTTMFLMGQWTLKQQLASLNQIANNQRGQLLTQEMVIVSRQMADATEKHEFNQAYRRLINIRQEFIRSMRLQSGEISQHVLATTEGVLPHEKVSLSAFEFITQVSGFLKLNFADPELPAAADEIANSAGGELAQNLEECSTLVKYSASYRLRQARRIEAALFVAALAVLVFEALCVFQPILTAHEKIDWAANHDPLTLLPNRRFLSKRAKASLLESKRSGSSIGFMHLDLDCFKGVNDRMGHLAGDAILRAVATRLRKNLSTDHLIARVGGDEFAVLCPSVNDIGELEASAEKIIHALSKPIVFEDVNCSIGCSIGLAISGPKETDFERVLMDADIALYAAKNNGRNQYQIISDVLRDEFEYKETVTREIREGIEQKQFVPFFQPQFDSKTGHIVGVEALARWCKPNAVFAPNAEFIKFAEETGLLPEIDEQIFCHSLEAFVRWRDLGHHIPRVGLNFSLKELESPNIVEKLKARLEKFDLEPQDISIEILESVFFDSNTQVIVNNINALSAAGFMIELDDFGTGHAAVTSLLDLSIDRIKLDQALIQDIEYGGAGETITRTLIRLADELDISTVAEGVETAKQVEILCRIGCTDHQGFYYAKPMSSDRFCEWLSEQYETRNYMVNAV